MTALLPGSAPKWHPAPQKRYGPKGVRLEGLILVTVGLGAAACGRAPEGAADATPATSVSVAARPPPLPPPAPVVTTRRCHEQPVQDFLLRKHQMAQPKASAAVRERIAAARERAVRYRTEQYGFFPGFGRRDQNPHPPRYYAETTRFMGLEVRLHRKVVPALHCVEQALATDCGAHPYQPRRLSGLREQNTYQDYEVSNHVYGIALDVDSDLNPCCGCVAPWNQNPVCKKPADSAFQRMAMPECWVRTFERYGFYWLGHDELEDTMHFEFLGDPDRIFE
jgi:hypothetical protein